MVVIVAKFSPSSSYTSKIPYLEGEEVFGFTKRKQDLPPCLEKYLHKHDHVNFSCSQMEITSIHMVKAH
jgi:hypothetical protein